MDLELETEITEAVKRAIEDARNGVIERWAKRPPNAPLFLLCQHLLSVPQAVDLDMDELLPFVATFWETVEDDCSNGMYDVDDAENAFVVLWRSGKVHDARSNRLEAARKIASNGAARPPEAERYTSEGMQQLVHICFLLSKSNTQGKFFLSGADAGEILGKPPRSGLLALKRLCADGILQNTQRGNSLARKANEYAYTKSPSLR